MDVRYLDLSVHRDGRALVDGLDLVVGSGAVLGLVGPNGSGKSTALRCLYRALAPTGGTVLVDGRDAATGSARTHAQVVAALPQQGSAELDFTVEEVVATGRFAHGYAGGRLAGEHLLHVDAALVSHGLEPLRHRPVSTLSGGERQRALLARAVAQDPRVLVLDEPTNHLDLGHQLGLLADLRRGGERQRQRQRRTTLVALHDLNLAAAVCDELAVLHDGRLVACGPPEAVLGDADLLRTVFGVTGYLVRHPTTGVPQLLWDLPLPDRAGPSRQAQSAFLRDRSTDPVQSASLRDRSTDPAPEEVAQQPSRRAGTPTHEKTVTSQEAGA